MPGLVRPHGAGPLKPLMLAGEALAAERARARTLPQVRVSSREKGDLIMLGIGGFTPLEGFMSRADWEGVCDGMRMASGLFWPIPITLSVDEAVADGIETGADIALLDPDAGEAARDDAGEREVPRSTRRTSACRYSAPPTSSTPA